LLIHAISAAGAFTCCLSMKREVRQVSQKKYIVYGTRWQQAGVSISIWAQTAGDMSANLDKTKINLHVVDNGALQCLLSSDNPSKSKSVDRHSTNLPPSAFATLDPISTWHSRGVQCNLSGLDLAQGYIMVRTVRPINIYGMCRPLFMHEYLWVRGYAHSCVSLGSCAYLPDLLVCTHQCMWSSPPLGHPFLRQTWPNRPLKA